MFDEPADAKNYRLMKDIEGQHRLVTVDLQLVVEIQVFGYNSSASWDARGRRRLIEFRVYTRLDLCGPAPEG